MGPNGDMNMSAEVKLEAGQWYRDGHGDIVYCIGFNPCQDSMIRNYSWVCCTKNTRVRYYRANGRFDQFKPCLKDIAEHLPDCDSFEWVPTSKLQLREGAWYERKDGKIVGPCRKSGLDDLPWFFGNFFYRNDGTNNATDWCCLIREVEPPQPPQPKYRPFKDGHEFAPYRDDWFTYRLATTHEISNYRVVCYSDTHVWVGPNHIGHTWGDAFVKFKMAGDLPFGVLDDGT
jgi:hypothetical protein